MSARRLATTWLLRLLVLAALLVGGREARADVELPVVVERGAIHVRAAAGLAAEAHWLAARAERDLAHIAADLDGLPRPATIEIRLVEETDQLASVAPPGRGAPRWAAGVAYPDVGVLALALRRGGSNHDLAKTLRHELAHLALGAAVPDAPRWLHEGFAWQQAPELSLARLETLAGMAWFGGVKPFDQLEAGFPAAEAPASRAYAQSYDFVGFLANRGAWPDADDDGDRWPFRHFLRALAGGASLDDAAHDSFNATMDELYREWKADLVRRYMLIPASVFASFLWVVAAFLLVLGWWRRRRRSKAQLAAWEAEDQAAASRRAESTLVNVPPVTAIDQAVLDGHGNADDDEESPEPPPPRWVN